ncbi:alpha/beta hydrolase [Catellatospora methionotrophica]|uniref:Alpha/beta hydrolase n=1 Tax=Catellatospora methionotrophica TaxID=121620 RepID=A0A8J3LGF9_9ACTN|nr:alpha/beta hydrolase [Catellatospora methionotrophica]GIG14706.1 alpha/beta hydrolase [Catellatospora methionotrophica]
MIDLVVVKTGDGRQLAVEVSGARDGFPVFLLHGTPGSKSGPRPRPIALYRMGVRLISYDRPGYGDSTRQRGRRVIDAAQDVKAIAEHLQIDRFAVVGRSGGGPHALACAAALGDRVIRTVVLVGLAPAAAPGLDWFEGMAPSNVDEYGEADADLAALMETLRNRTADALADPDSMLRFLAPQMSAPDRRVIDDVTIRRLLHETYREALQRGPEGWIDDALAFRKHWGFELSEVKSPVRLWHGADDTFSPESHSRWLESQLHDAEAEIQPDAGHFGAMEILPRILAWVVGQGTETTAHAPATAR